MCARCEYKILKSEPVNCYNYILELLSEGVKRLGDSVARPGWMNRVAPICLRNTRQANMVASTAMPPMAERTSGVKEECSTSLNLCSYALFLIASCFR